VDHITALGERLGNEVVQAWEQSDNLSGMEQTIR
jgi:hypothetical protein